ncbi:MAG: VWA domain-containing protein [Burkholderiaceae bacterium]|nr:VWA domain-containing protein [Burkholderiaceae bacterium]
MLVAPRQSPGHLAENVMHFARVLRSAGISVGTDRIQLTLQALGIAGFDSRNDFHAVLSTCMLDRIEHKELFDQAFELFWRDPDLEGRMRAMLLPKVRAQAALTPEQRENRRLGDALFPNPRPDAPQPQPDEQIDLDAAFTVSDTEVLRKADFDTMSADEWRAARRALAMMRWVFEPLPTRRASVSPRAGRIDWRATLQTMARHGGELGTMRWRRPRPLPAPMVVLADISGSMSRYSRMLLHFAHALGHAEARVESFVFGTRLTRTTRLLKSRDPDVAVSQVVKAVEDWSGGTRITHSLHEFNQRWARRALSSRTTVLLISDGLEHGDTQALSHEMERLAKSCRRLIWLNPLLRFEKFQPRAAGIRAMLPHVDRFLPVHNLESLEHLVRLLGSPDKPERLH